MAVLLYVLICIVSFILVALVLMQDSKSGLGGGITGGATMNTFGGNTDKALVKATAVIASIFFVLILISLLINQKPKATTLIEMADTVKVDTNLKEQPKAESQPKQDAQPAPTEVVVPIPATEPAEANKAEEATVETPKAEAPKEEPAKEGN